MYTFHAYCMFMYTSCLEADISILFQFIAFADNVCDTIQIMPILTSSQTVFINFTKTFIDSIGPFYQLENTGNIDLEEEIHSYQGPSQQPKKQRVLLYGGPGTGVCLFCSLHFELTCLAVDMTVSVAFILSSFILCYVLLNYITLYYIIGKSFCINELINYALEINANVTVACPTGFLASQYKVKFDQINCDTIHSTFYYPTRV